MLLLLLLLFSYFTPAAFLISLFFVVLNILIYLNPLVTDRCLYDLNRLSVGEKRPFVYVYFRAADWTKWLRNGC